MTTSLIRNLHDHLIRQMAEVGLGDRPQPSCHQQQLVNLRDCAERLLGFDLPEEYSQLLAMTNGICWNGATVYASERSQCIAPDGEHEFAASTDYIDGFVEQNVAMRRNDQQFASVVVFGETEADWLVYDLIAREHQLRSRVTWDVHGRFNSFGVMLWSGLAVHLRLPHPAQVL